MHGIVSSRRWIYAIAGLLSLLFSLWMLTQTELINPDGICYIKSAEGMKKGLHYAMHLCDQAGWPFYSMIIFGVQSLTHFSFENSAYFLNALLSLMSVLIFIRIVDMLSLKEQKYGILWIAAFVILFSNIFNDVRHYIVRDHGYFAFYLLAILFLLNFFLKRKWFDALGWGSASMVATLFRIEGAIFLIVIPFVAFLDLKQPFFIRLKSFLQLNILSIIGAIILCLLLFFHPDESLGRLREINLHHALKFISVLQLKSAALSEYILNRHAMVNPKIILFFTLVVWYLYSAITNVSFIYMLLTVYAWWKKLLQAPRMMHVVLWAYLLANIVLTALFLASNMFISKRYLVAQSLILMLWVPFALLAVLKQWKTRKLLVIFVLILLLFSSMGGIFEFGYSKRYIRDAGVWLQQHAPPNAKIYSNDFLVKYYSKHFDDELFQEINPSEKPRFQEYDYIVIRQNKKNPAFDEIQVKPLQIFQNSRGDKVIIYQGR